MGVIRALIYFRILIACASSLTSATSSHVCVCRIGPSKMYLTGIAFGRGCPAEASRRGKVIGELEWGLLACQEIVVTPRNHAPYRCWSGEWRVGPQPLMVTAVWPSLRPSHSRSTLFISNRVLVTLQRQGDCAPGQQHSCQPVHPRGAKCTRITRTS